MSPSARVSPRRAVRRPEDRRNATVAEGVSRSFCAMIASGRAGKLAGPGAQAAADHTGSDTPQLQREDGARACICNLAHGQGAARPQYWKLPDGEVEFAALRAPGDIGTL